MISRTLLPVCRNALLLRNLNQQPSKMTSLLTISSRTTNVEPTTTTNHCVIGVGSLLSKRFFARRVDYDSDSDIEKLAEYGLKPKKAKKIIKKKKAEPDIIPPKKLTTDSDDEEDAEDEVEEEEEEEEEANEGGVPNTVKKEKILYNEFLIRELMQRSGETSATMVQVRLIIHRRKDKPLVEVKTLDEAITISAQKNVDLIGMDLSQKPPTVAVRNLKSFLSVKVKKNAKAERQNKPDKQVRFNAGIAEGDFNRRMKDVLKFLSEGHACIISATAKGGGGTNGAEKETSMVNLLNKIIAKVEDVAHAPEETEIDEGARYISIRLEPARKGKAKKQ